MFFKKSKQQSKTNLNQHFVFLEVPIDVVAPEVMQWGTSEWWPKNCLTTFKKETEGDLRVGTIFKQQIKKPLVPPWKVEVTQLIPNRLMERTFRSGMLKGYEALKIGERANGTRVDYELHYNIRGPLNMILWPLFYKKQHDANIKMILEALKTYVTQKYHRQQEELAKEPLDDQTPETK